MVILNFTVWWEREGGKASLATRFFSLWKSDGDWKSEKKMDFLEGFDPPNLPMHKSYHKTLTTKRPPKLGGPDDSEESGVRQQTAQAIDRAVARAIALPCQMLNL